LGGPCATHGQAAHPDRFGDHKVSAHHTDRVVTRPATELPVTSEKASGLSVASDLDAGLIQRSRLLELLSGGHHIVSVAAPAGSGKTVFLRSWMRREDLARMVAWVTVDRQEHEPQRFWLQVLEAMRGTDSARELVQALTPAPDLDGWTISERLLRDLAPLRQPLWLVIDDLHELRSTEALRQLEVLLMRRPDQLRFVLSSRQDVRLGLHRLRLTGELAEIRAAQLRFSLEETGAVFAAAGVRLTEPAVEMLYKRTEGWAAGVRLAALSLHGHPDPEQFAVEFSGSDRTVAEYLLVEVLDRQPEQRRRLLLQTSVLERVSGSLADHLTGDAEAERILQELEDAQAFVVSLDANRSWFRYHQLFAELLRLELRRTAPETVGTLHRSAAAWFAERGHWLDAIHHAQEAEDWEAAAEMLFDQWRSLQLSGEAQIASALLSRFPAPLSERIPELAVLTADDHVARGGADEAERYLAMATAHSEAAADSRRLEIELAVVRLAVARHRGNLPAVIDRAQPLLSIANASGASEPLGEDYKAIALITLGVAEMWTAHHEDADSHLEQGIRLARLAQRPFLELRGLAHAAFVSTVTSLELAIARSREAITLAASLGWEDEPATAIADAVLAAALVWRGRLDEALDPLERTERNLRSSSEPATAVQVHVARGMLELARGRHQEAVTALQAGTRLGEGFVSRHTLARQARALMMQAWLNLGELERVDHAIAQLDPAERDSSEILTALAALRLARNDPTGASSALAPVLEGSVPLVHRLGRLRPLLLEAIARAAVGDLAASRQAVERALEIAEQDGAIWPFLNQPVTELLEQHTRFQTTHVSLISDILSVAGGRRLVGAQSAIVPLTEPLSESEMRILRYLPTNLSAPEIAGDLYLSVNTVKTHMRHLYAKLGTHKRAEAVERARALGLLAPSMRR
jgi:LuxR family transcriptional regulator, maltose regulon positive regulatory protein